MPLDFHRTRSGVLRCDIGEAVWIVGRHPSEDGFRFGYAADGKADPVRGPLRASEEEAIQDAEEWFRSVGSA